MKTHHLGNKKIIVKPIDFLHPFITVPLFLKRDTWEKKQAPYNYTQKKETEKTTKRVRE